MDLDRSLLKEFAKVVNDVGDKPEPKQYVHGTVTTGAGNTKCVMLDGSDMLTPISEVVNAEAGDRVLVSVSNHQATVIGNITFPPSARKEDQAIESANGALNQSNQAMEKAKDAQTKASSAITDSSVASALANEAKSESAKAQEAANTAIQNADEAKQLAQASSNKSDETQQLANQVKDSVTAANKDISKLKTEVKTANDNIASANTKLDTQAGEIATIKETYSTKVETESTKADLTTEISKQVGALQTTIEKNISTKTENVALEKKLQTQITQNANSISSTVTKVEKLESDTTEQQKNIDKALQDAQAANTAAGVAKSDAEKAKTAADTAQKAADDATAKAESATTAANLAEQKVTAADKQLQQAKTDLAESQENLKNVTTRVGATEQEIADAKEKVDTANANVTKALTDVAEAKNAASKANEAASKAQGEATAANKAASDAQTKAADAQKVANQASADALKAQKDLAALTNRVTKAETNITQTNEAITAQATKITETSNKIDNLQIGGRNLVQCSFFTVPQNNGANGYQKKFYGDDVILTENVAKIFKPNTTYTVSYKYRQDEVTPDINVSDDDLTLIGAMTIYSNAHRYTKYVFNNSNGFEMKAGESTSFKYTFTTPALSATEDKWSICFYGRRGLKSDGSAVRDLCTFYDIKIELGNKATDWTPAPEDLENDLHNNYYSKTETDAQIKVSADKISQTVTETNKIVTSANKNASDALNKANSLTDRANSGEFNGRGVKSTTVEYQASTSGTTVPTGVWSTTIPNVAAGSYLWTKTTTNYTSGTPTIGYSVARMGVNGAKGDKGVKGNDGKGIKSTEVTYQIWANGTSTPTGTWSSTPPKTTADKPYLWTRTVITYTDNAKSTSYSVGSTPEGIVVGGRNLLMQYIRAGGMTTKINDLSIKVGTGVADTYFFLKTHQKLIKGETYTISCDASNVPSGCNWSFGVTLQGGPWQLYINKNGRCYATGTPNTDTVLPGTEIIIIDDLNGRPSTAANIILSNFKLEIGNKATDWTPAPEDQEQYVNDKIAASEKTTEESYKALINQTAKDISLLVQSVKSTADSNSSSISTIASNLKVTSDGLNATKTSINTLTDAVNGTISKQELQQYLRWNGDNLELGDSVKPFKCRLSDTELAFYQNEDKVAWISNKELYILKAIIAQSIGCGNFMFVDEGDLGFSLI